MRPGIRLLPSLPSTRTTGRTVRGSLAGALLLCTGLVPITAPALAQAPGLDAPEEIMIRARRMDESVQPSTVSVTIDRQAIATAPQTRLDALLSARTGASLFRRSDSLTAHPTAQGLTLRGIGANGAGRALVMVDGVPQNDPFGGWIYWSTLPVRNLHDVTVLPGSGAGVWGSQALSGVIAARTAREGSGGYVDLYGGSQNTIAGEAGVQHAFDGLHLDVSGGGFDTDGSYLVAAEQRGPMDIRAASDEWHVSATAEVAPTPDLRLIGRIRYFEEARTNGLDLSRNSTQGTDASLSLLGETGPDAPSWQMTLYWQDRTFENSFASVTADRTGSTKVLDQIDVPARGLGANALVRWPVGGGTVVEAGADIRHNRGETNELFRNLGAGFTRIREAGGEQIISGGHLAVIHTGDALSWDLAGRVDYWRNSDGRLTEAELSDGTLVRNDAIANRDGTVASGRAGVALSVTPDTMVKAAAYAGFRVPTLNELYRPFRVGNDITEANPDLDPERLYGMEATLSHHLGDTAEVSLTAYLNWLHDGVGNVTLAYGPGNFPPTGFVPAGGSLRQRQNIDSTRITGMEAAAAVDVTTTLTLTGSYRYTHARITRFDADPTLEGRVPVQVPTHRTRLAADWKPVPELTLSADVEYASRAFEDDQNLRRLKGYAVANLYAGWQASDAITLYVKGTNLTDTRIVTGLSGDGLISVGAPARIFGGVTMTY